MDEIGNPYHPHHLVIFSAPDPDQDHERGVGVLLACPPVLKDERIKGHETDFAKVNASVTAMPKVGLNPYALGLRLFEHIEEMENKGRFSLDYFRLHDAVARKTFDRKKNTGRDVIFSVRENMEDFSFINTFVDQEFMDRHRLFLAGKRFNPQRSTWQYYIKSRKVADYRQMIINTLYHPPDIRVIEERPGTGSCIWTTGSRTNP